jgi:drug/metabolite transporter (DMT)-like permease
MQPAAMAQRRQAFGPYAWCVAAAALFGASTPLTKPLLADVGPVLLSGLLYWGAAAAVAPAAVRSRRRRQSGDRRSRWYLAGAAFFGGVVGPVLLLSGLALAPAGSVSLWLVLETMATAVLARVLFHEHLGASGWIATVLVVGAGAMLAEPQLAGWRPALLVAAACVAWGLDNNLTSLIDGYSTAEITAIKGLAAGCVTVPAGLLLGEHAAITSVAAAAAVGASGYGVSLMLYVAGAQQLGATRSQLVFSSAPLFGLALAAAMLGEPVGLRHGIAVLLMGSAVWLLQREKHEHPHRHDAVEHTHWHRHDDDHHLHDHAAPVAPDTWHEHRHRHPASTHSHAHRPDLHHRHEHGDATTSAAPRA